MYKFIVDPVTGKNFKTNSKKGRSIINNYSKMLIGGSEKWSGTYSCKGLDRDNCNNQPNNRCKWSDAGNYCRKSQSASKKRGKRNWNILKKKMISANLDLKKEKNILENKISLNNKKKSEFRSLVEEYMARINQIKNENSLLQLKKEKLEEKIKQNNL